MAITRSIEEICRTGSPSRNEGDKIVSSVLSGKRKSALTQISSAFDCSLPEAELVLQGYKNVVLGQPSKMVEVKLSDVEVAVSSSDPFAIHTQYVARRGNELGSLLQLSQGSYYFNQRDVKAREICQVWKMVPLSELAGEA
jgi:predicted nucleic acid-binding protein